MKQRAQTPVRAPAPDGSRPGGRSARVRRAVLDATLDLLVERGSPQLGVELIAARAGVHKTTVYRRWHTRSQLLKEALVDWTEARIEVPDAGSFDADVRALARSLAAYLALPRTLAVMRTIASEHGRDAELADWLEGFFAHEVGALSVVVERAVRRGELSARADGYRLIEVLVGPMMQRILISGKPLAADFADEIAEIALVGFSCACDRRRPASPQPPDTG